MASSNVKKTRWQEAQRLQLMNYMVTNCHEYINASRRKRLNAFFEKVGLLGKTPKQAQDCFENAMRKYRLALKEARNTGSGERGDGDEENLNEESAKSSSGKLLVFGSEEMFSLCHEFDSKNASAGSVYNPSLLQTENSMSSGSSGITLDEKEVEKDENRPSTPTGPPSKKSKKDMEESFLEVCFLQNEALQVIREQSIQQTEIMRDMRNYLKTLARTPAVMKDSSAQTEGYMHSLFSE